MAALWHDGRLRVASRRAGLVEQQVDDAALVVRAGGEVAAREGRAEREGEGESA